MDAPEKKESGSPVAFVVKRRWVLILMALAGASPVGVSLKGGYDQDQAARQVTETIQAQVSDLKNTLETRRLERDAQLAKEYVRKEELVVVTQKLDQMTEKLARLDGFIRAQFKNFSAIDPRMRHVRYDRPEFREKTWQSKNSP